MLLLILKQSIGHENEPIFVKEAREVVKSGSRIRIRPSRKPGCPTLEKQPGSGPEIIKS